MENHNIISSSPVAGGGRFSASPGQAFFGAPLGVLLIDCVAPFVPGSVGNASTFTAPARYRTVPGLTVERILSPDAGACEPAVVAAAQALATEGARMITSNCGFAIRFQRAVSAAVDVPVLLSSLLLAPMLERVLPGDKGLGIITASADSLTQDLLSAAGMASPDRVGIAGLDDKPAFTAGLITCVGELDRQALELETVEVATSLIERRPDTGALLLECAELPPYAAAVQRATGVPVFDITSMVELVLGGMCRTPFRGFF